MKKVISLVLSLIMVLSLTACGAAEKPAEEAAAKTELKVAIIQQLDHSSLDEIREAIKAQLNTLADPTNYTITIEEYNGQNDTSMLTQIATQVVADEPDMIIPIATLAAQYAVLGAEGTDIPIVYAAISDPASAGLTDLPTVTGVSDALNTPFILDMMLSVQPDVQTVGLLYSTSEINSLTPIAEAKEYLDSKGIAYIEKTGTTSGEITEAAASLVGRVDAVFTPTDNAVMAAEASVAELLNNAGIPHYTGADSFVLSGAFTTCGVNYTELGTKTADIAFDILMGGAIGDFHVMDGGIITVNTDTAEKCGIDYSAFSTMANTVNEVTTVAE
ncbi:MAG: ABC transporter substrate-binding protein [Oscillospiraceae bacterium]|nr:ABC transporter substrate-binding protein [Oscillospiraceae bacterium]